MKVDAPFANNEQEKPPLVTVAHESQTLLGFGEAGEESLICAPYFLLKNEFLGRSTCPASGRFVM